MERGFEQAPVGAVRIKQHPTTFNKGPFNYNKTGRGLIHHKQLPSSFTELSLYGTSAPPCISDVVINL